MDEFDFFITRRSSRWFHDMEDASLMPERRRRSLIWPSPQQQEWIVSAQSIEPATHRPIAGQNFTPYPSPAPRMPPLVARELHFH